MEQKGKIMAEEENAANQNLEDGAQDTATQTAEDSAQQQVDDASASVDKGQDDAGREQEGLKAGIVAEREKRQAVEAQLQVAQAQNIAYQQQAQQQVTAAQVKPPETTYQQALREASLEGETYITQEQQAQVFARKDQLDAQINQDRQVANQNAQFAATHEDYSEVVGQGINGVFVPSQELNALLAKKPYLRNVANSSAQAAYDLVMQERQLVEYTKSQVVDTERDNRQKADAQTGPMSASGGSGGVSESSQFNTVAQVQEMEARIAKGEFPTNRQ